MVRSAGLDPQTDVTLLDLAVGMQMPAVVGGSVDATLSLEPVGSIAVASGLAQRAMTNPVSMFIADPFYSGVSLLDGKVPVGTAAGRQAAWWWRSTRQRDWPTTTSRSTRRSFPKYTPIREQQLALLAQPYLRGFNELNDTDLNSYQALVDVFLKEGVLTQKVNVRDHILHDSHLPK